MYDKNDSFFRRLVERHVSGQLKVAPEHCALNALTMMGKPPIGVFEDFRKKFFKISKEAGLEQYLVPYLMSSHPGATMKDAVEMALWLKEWGYSPEQVQDFYPTPGTISTVMYYTGIHPMTGKAVNVTTDYREKQLQRALLQYKKPENANLVREALRIAKREDLIGNGSECLVKEAFGKASSKYKKPRKPAAAAAKGQRKRPQRAYKTVEKSSERKSKVERVFGSDAARIMKEADRVSKTNGKKRTAANNSRARKGAKKG